MYCTDSILSLYAFLAWYYISIIFFFSLLFVIMIMQLCLKTHFMEFSFTAYVSLRCGPGCRIVYLKSSRAFTFKLKRKYSSLPHGKCILVFWVAIDNQCNAQLNPSIKMHCFCYRFLIYLSMYYYIVLVLYYYDR